MSGQWSSVCSGNSGFVQNRFTCENRRKDRGNRLRFENGFYQGFADSDARGHEAREIRGGAQEEKVSCVVLYYGLGRSSVRNRQDQCHR